MQVFHIQGDQFTELQGLPVELPATGYFWLSTGRREFEVNLSSIQAALQRWTGAQVVDLHVADLLNNQLPSNFDYTSCYDLLVFRRLAAGEGSAAMFLDDSKGTMSSAKDALAAIDTSPVGFAIFDRVLVSIHPADCQVREYFANRFQHQLQSGSGDTGSSDVRGGARLPTSPADLMLRMVNHMVDNYLGLRRLLSRQLDYLQQELFNPRSPFNNWQMLLDSRNALHLLEDTCEDQRSAITEWIDALDEWPPAADAAGQRERDLLRVRSRDLLEHIGRVLGHVRRLESSAESAVQMHFSAQSNRTNDIMRTLTVLTAIFLPLNLVTGVFGMNFEVMPLLKLDAGFWISIGLMVLIASGLIGFFLRKRYVGGSGGKG
jgi:Mg2+ and Co2+ transporter CorA